MTFVHTNDGMLTVEKRKGDYLLKNEVLGVIHEMISSTERVLVSYNDENDTRKDADWFKCAKAKYEGELEVLERIKKMLY